MRRLAIPLLIALLVGAALCPVLMAGMRPCGPRSQPAHGARPCCLAAQFAWVAPPPALPALLPASAATGAAGVSLQPAMMGCGAQLRGGDCSPPDLSILRI